jgi:hypothetical protein
MDPRQGQFDMIIEELATAVGQQALARSPTATPATAWKVSRESVISSMETRPLPPCPALSRPNRTETSPPRGQLSSRLRIRS